MGWFLSLSGYVSGTVLLWAVLVVTSVAATQDGAALQSDNTTSPTQIYTHIPAHYSTLIHEEEGLRTYNDTLTTDSDPHDTTAPTAFTQNDDPLGDVPRLTYPPNHVPIMKDLTTPSTSVSPCDHPELCESEIVCSCYFYKRKGKCVKMFDCSNMNLTIETLLNTNFTDVQDKNFDVNFTSYKLSVSDLDVLTVDIQTTANHGIWFFGPLQRLPCTTKIHAIIGKWEWEPPFNLITQVFCDNRNLTDKDIDNITLPALTKRLNLQKNKLKTISRLEKLLDSLPHLEQVDLSDNKLTTIPKINVTQKITPFFSLNLDNNNIKSYDSSTLVQYASPDDRIHISFVNNPFMCDCEAYRTNEVFVQHRTLRKGGLMCAVLDEKTGKKMHRMIPTNVEEYWRNKCDSSSNEYFYLIFTWHNCLDTFLVIGNLFFVYIIYDLSMAIRESRVQRGDKKDAKKRRDSIKSNKSNRKESVRSHKDSVTIISMRKISKFSRKGSKAEPEPEIPRVDARPPRRPLLDVIVCAIDWGYESVRTFINTRVFKKKEVHPEEDDKRSTLEWREHNRLRDLRLDGWINSQVLDTSL